MGLIADVGACCSKSCRFARTRGSGVGSLSETMNSWKTPAGNDLLPLMEGHTASKTYDAASTERFKQRSEAESSATRHTHTHAAGRGGTPRDRLTTFTGGRGYNRFEDAGPSGAARSPDSVVCMIFGSANVLPKSPGPKRTQTHNRARAQTATKRQTIEPVLLVFYYTYS